VADHKKDSPFAKLAALKAQLPEGERREHASEAPAPKVDARFAGKLVVAFTRKGRGGKTVTTVQGVRASASELDTLAKELRHALGCGASVDEATIVVQGDQVQRVKAFLEGKGASKVVIGT
jgi:translation initiation factor 1